MIVLVDLDGTLVDRSAAFAHWVRRFVFSCGGCDDDVRWLLELDDDGYAPRADVAAALQQRFGLHDDVPRLVERLLFEHVESVEPFPGVVEELRALRAGARSGAAVVVVVTNGTAAQQERKLAVSGLLPHVDDVVVSESAGSSKPDASIFALALERARSAGGTGDSWMVGDHPVADIRGGSDSGLLTGWVSRGRRWPGGAVPDVAAADTAEVLAIVRRSGSRGSGFRGGLGRLGGSAPSQ